MAERLKILKHHIELIRAEGFGIKGRGNILQEIITHTASLGSSEYPFIDGISRHKFAKVMEKAVIAVLDDKFEEIPDFKDEDMTKQNYDLICFECPNYESGEDICKVAKKIKEEIDGPIPSRSTKH